ncbi:MAG: alpha/beta hydrolase [Acidimicrobiales bacterium]|jgi:pimeloyl-ACP methyl ester carboxylesterase
MLRESASATANGLQLAYETFGERSDPALLLVMGLGAQMIAWPDELCESLAGQRHFVVRFDNRDAGLSSHLPELGTPSPLAVLTGRARAPYSVDDMADDAAGLLETIDISAAHVVGASMGGFIAQAMVLRHPARVRSLTLIMTSTGSRLVGHPRARLALRLVRRRPATDREMAVDTVVETFRQIGSPGFPFDEERIRQLGGRSYDRAYDPGGYLRQLAAVTTQSDRTRALRQVGVPTVVLHGLSDPLVSVSGGRALARAIPGARFVGFPGMGHDLPGALWPMFAEEICSIARKADSRREPGTDRP